MPTPEPTPPTFPSLDSTKLSTILSTINPEVMNQVQLDILSIVKTYRSGLEEQLNSILMFEKVIIKRHTKVNELFKKKLIDHAELLNWKLNKKIDSFKIQHDENAHYIRSSRGLCDVNELCGDVMGKLMGVVDVLKDRKMKGKLKVVDGERFPLLSKVLREGDNSYGVESYEDLGMDHSRVSDDHSDKSRQTNLNDTKEGGEGEELQEFNDIEEDLMCKKVGKESEAKEDQELQRLNSFDAIGDQGNEIEEALKSDDDGNEADNEAEEFEIQPEQKTFDDEEKFERESQSPPNSISQPNGSIQKSPKTRSSTGSPKSTELNPLDTLERTILKYKSIQLLKSNTSIPSPTSTTSTTTTSTTMPLVQVSSPTFNEGQSSILSENLKKFI